MKTKIKPGDVLFIWGHGFFPPLIEAVTHGPSHCAIFKDENTLIEAQAGRLVGEIDLSFYLEGNARLEVWSDPTLTDEQRQEMIKYAETLYGIPYDYLLIPLEFLHYEFKLPIDWFHEHKHRICSSLMYGIANHVNKKWADEENCAPAGLIDYGVLKKMIELPIVGLKSS